MSKTNRNSGKSHLAVFRFFAANINTTNYKRKNPYLRSRNPACGCGLH